jgi:hypothetical protein
MSEQVKELWTLSDRIEYQTILCADGLSLWHPSRTQTERCARNERIVSDHNTCLGIPDPPHDVPELRAALLDLYDEQNGPPLQHPRHKARWVAAYDRAQAILVKTERVGTDADTKGREG